MRTPEAGISLRRYSDGSRSIVFLRDETTWELSVPAAATSGLPVRLHLTEQSRRRATEASALVSWRVFSEAAETLTGRADPSPEVLSPVLDKLLRKAFGPLSAALDPEPGRKRPLPGWDQMSDLDRGAALLHVWKAENEGHGYARREYPARYLEDPVLVALKPKAASHHAMEVTGGYDSICDTLAPDEYERLYDLALAATARSGLS